MNPLVVAARETSNVLRSFWRNRWGAFFTILLPVMLLVLFGAINRDATVPLGPHGLRIAYTLMAWLAVACWPPWGRSGGSAPREGEDGK